MSADESITSLPEAVAALGALPVPALPEPQAPSGGFPPALPWAALMDDEDLHDFLGELADAAIRLMDGRAALVEVERACATWRLIAEAQHGHNTAPGPDAVEPVDTLPAWLHWRFGKHGQRWDSLDEGDRSYWEHHAQAVRRAVERGGFKAGGAEVGLALGAGPDERPVNGLTKTFAPVASLREPEGEHYPTVHHAYRLGHDMPETGGSQ